MKSEKNATILGVNFGREFFGGPETLEKQSRIFFAGIVADEFTDYLWAIFRKFARPK